MAIELRTKETPIVEKTRELCQTIVDQPQFGEMVKAMDSFLENSHARGLYEEVSDLQERLVAKQNRGETLQDAEISEFEAKRGRLMDDETARAYLDARQQIQEVQQTISQYVSQTFDLGRVPLPEEISSGGGCCGGGGGGGGGCGCQ